MRAKKFGGDRVIVARGLRCHGAKAPGRLGCSGADVTSVLARSVGTVWDRGRTAGRPTGAVWLSGRSVG